MRASFLTTAFLAIAVLATSVANTAVADTNDLVHKPIDRRGEGKVPQCDDPSVLNKISKRFAKVQFKFRDSDLEFSNLERVRETGFEPNEIDQNDRRFCAAHVHLTDGNHPTLYYLIQEHEGLASIGWGVDYCVNGYDFERAHGAHCRSVRSPF
ncbi:MAG: hypothetical protein AAFW47_03670 [Pseudomonadota bacterium]